MNGLTTIYGLIDPNTGECRYVGKTVKTVRKRLGQHIRLATRYGGRTHLCNWIRSLDGAHPKVMELDTVIGNWQESEQFWIAYLNAIGCRLTNGTKGGEGVLGRKVSQETRDRIGAKHRGKAISILTRAQMSESHKGLVRSESHRLNMAKARRDRSDRIDREVAAAVASGSSVANIVGRGYSLRSIGRALGVCHHTVSARLAA